MRPSLFQRIRRFVLWHRRSLAAIAAALCVLTVTSALAPASPAGAPVVVALRSIPAGATITADDVTTRAVPPGLVPAQPLTSVDAAIGDTAAVALEAGTIVGRSFLLDAAPVPAGMRLVPVRLPDADLARLLRTGDRVSVVAPDATGTIKIVAAGLRVAAIPRPAESGGHLQPREQHTLVMLEVPDASAAEVSMASLQRGLSVVIG